jgi:hypothetical protein
MGGGISPPEVAARMKGGGISPLEDLAIMTAEGTALVPSTLNLTPGHDSKIPVTWRK